MSAIPKRTQAVIPVSISAVLGAYLQANATRTRTSKSSERKDLKHTLKDTQTAAMELRRPLENNERHWKVEKMELLERFDSERKEWESQWKIMQKKIEELYQEVKLRRENKLNGYEEGLTAKSLQLSVPIYNSEPRNSSDKARHMLQSTDKKMDVSSIAVPKNSPKPKEKKPHTLESSHPQHNVLKLEPEKYLSTKMSKPENDALNDALREIARVSEELCKFQDEIRGRSNCKRMGTNLAACGNYDAGAKDFKIDKNMPSSKVSKTNERSTENYVNNPVILNSLSQQSEIGGTSLVSHESSFPPSYFSSNIASQLSSANESYDTYEGCSSVCSNVNSYHVVTSHSDAVGKNDNGLCHVSCLYDIGTLDKSNPVKSFLDNIADYDSLVFETDAWNSTMSISRLPCSNFCSDEIMSEHYPNASEFRPEMATNGKLAAKIDEFNRMVFKTEKGSKVFHEPLFDMCHPAKQEPCIHLLGDSLATAQTNAEPDNEAEMTVESYENSTIQSVKSKVQKWQANGSHSRSSYQNMLLEHNWTPSNLSGRPRSADSRSNYGVVEKLLKSYENKAPNHNSKHVLRKRTNSDFLLTDANSEKLTRCLEMLQIDQVTTSFNNDVPTHRHLRETPECIKLPEVNV
ncbi:uncharacterized protein KIAA0408 [Xenopus laevis]|uniref:Uncharacterized protein KIAA0408 n=1 Tax=Xenopus laevis TaxID=8355 RepID=A0A8J1KQS1_XENLA|nr:uncharacterized protein KIAA0408 [Xenopus laevis]